MAANTVSVYATGDIIPDRPNPETLFEFAMPTLKKADILFGQLEAALSDKGEPQLQTFPVRQMPSERVSGIVAAGFNVLSFASNHTLDRGEPGLFETMDVLAKNDIALIGAGKNIQEARRPAIFEKKGAKIAFLAYCSVLPRAYEARPDKPGCVPIRVSTSYEQVDWQPGAPPRIITIADKADLAAMVEDIQKARQQADIVIVSQHWGIHHVPAILAMYQKEVGYAAIDAGADLILGHHAHILKGIEVYKGKVIFYSLCNFVMPSVRGRLRAFDALYGIDEKEDHPDYVFHEDARKTIIAKCDIEGKKIKRVSFLPVMIDKYARPHVLARGDAESAEVVQYMEWLCRDQKLNAKFAWDGNELVIS